MADFNKPATTDTYANVLAYINAKFSDLALGLDPATSSPANLPTNAVRWNSANNRFEKYNGTAWAALSSAFDFNSITLSGGTANGVPYLNGSKQLVSGSALTFDGTTFQTTALTAFNGGAVTLKNTSELQWKDSGGTAQNVLFMFSDNNVYLSSPVAGSSMIFRGPSYGELMRLTSTGLGVGTSSVTEKLTVGGRIRSFNSSTGITIDTVTTALEVAYLPDNWGTSQRWRVYSTGGTSTDLTFSKDGHLGLAVTPSAWTNSFGVIQGLGGWSISHNGANSNSVDFLSNAYRSGGANTYLYVASSNATRYQQLAGAHAWFTAPSGTAGSAITFAQAMTLTANGDLVLGATSAVARLDVRGKGYFETSTNPTNGAVLTITNQTTTSNNGAKLVLDAYNIGTVAIGVPTNDSAIAFYSGPTTERARIDSAGQFGLGVTPKTWYTDRRVLQIGSASALYNTTDVNGSATGLGNNFYVDAANAFRYIAAGYATVYAQTYTGNHIWGVSATGAAGGALTLNTAMTLYQSGGLAVGAALDPGASNLAVYGTITSGSGNVMMVSGTSQATTSGTYKEYISIPSWVKRITVVLSGVSTTGSSDLLIQLGTSGGIQTTSYLGAVSSGNNAIVTSALSSGFIVGNNNSASAVMHAVVTLINVTGNVWTMQAIGQRSDTTTYGFTAGSVTLSGVLTTVRLTTVSGTPTFDAGNFNIIYE